MKLENLQYFDGVEDWIQKNHKVDYDQTCVLVAPKKLAELIEAYNDLLEEYNKKQTTN